MKKLSVIWFALGLGAKLQVLASLSLSEIAVLVSAPFIFSAHYTALKKDGVGFFFKVSILVFCGCIAACILNQTPFAFAIRGFAVTIIITCSVLLSYWLVRQDPGGFKYYLVGYAFSLTLSAFIFKQTAEVTMLGESTEEIMAGPLFWIGRLKEFAFLPCKGWYLSTPMCLNVLCPIVFGLYAAISSISGRSSALGSFAFAAIALIGGRRSQTMLRLSRYFYIIVICGFVLVGFLHLAYKTSVKKGWLDDAAIAKYENQTDGNDSIVRLLVGGRSASFIGLLACFDKPIVGWGPWAKDTQGYTERFILKYGSPRDIETLSRALAKSRLRERMLPCHSYLVEFWAWYGIFGLFYWLYVIYVFARYLKEDVVAVPQWFGWLACSIPNVLWGIFFSPFADRIGIPMMVVACLMARAIRQRKFALPYEMITEINKNEAR